jgi:hypothetical protein
MKEVNIKTADELRNELAKEEVSNFLSSADAMGENLNDYLMRVVWDLVWNGKEGWKYVDDDAIADIYENETGTKVQLSPLSDAEADLKDKRYKLAEREYESLEASECIDLLLSTVYNKMSDSTVNKLWEETNIKFS